RTRAPRAARTSSRRRWWACRRQAGSSRELRMGASADASSLERPDREGAWWLRSSPRGGPHMSFLNRRAAAVAIGLSFLLPLTAQAMEKKKPNNKKQAKVKAAQEGKKKAKARKELTGRDHQGNHDSLTKRGKRGGAKGDRHDNGIRQAG